MPTIIDYLEWRGDLAMSQSPFNDVDSLILCQFIYMKFDNILTEEKYCSYSTISEVVHILLSQYKETDRIADNIMPDIKADRRFLATLAASRRFGTMQVTRYVNRIDYEEQKQFCAITILTGDDSIYLAFRGTDDTLVGWKENFNMSFLTPVPSQKEAVNYLEEVARDYPENLRVGGHSKGGNLAAYAASYCQAATQDRIWNVYNNDGPGFDKKVIESEGYMRIQKRIHTFVPQTSIIGMLLEHVESYTVIHSNQTGLMQHSLYSWEVMGHDFIRLETVDENSRFIDQTLKSWISGMDNTVKEQFVDTFFDLLASTDAKNASDFSGENLKSIRTILKSMSHMDDATKKIMNQTIYTLYRCARTNRSKWKNGNKELPEGASGSADGTAQ